MYFFIYYDTIVKYYEIIIILNYIKMLYQINPTLCSNCNECADICTNNAINRNGFILQIDMNWCDDCGSCMEICSEDAISFLNIDKDQVEMYESLEENTYFLYDNLYEDSI